MGSLYWNGVDADWTTENWQDANGNPLTEVPGSQDTVSIASGTVTVADTAADFADFGNAQTIYFGAADFSDEPTLDTFDAFVDAQTSINETGNFADGIWIAQGQTVLLGQLNITGSDSSLDLSAVPDNAQPANAGVFDVGSGGIVTVGSEGTLDFANGTLQVDGLLQVDGGADLEPGTTLTGAGTIDVNENALLTIQGSVTKGTSVHFAGVGSTLQLDDLADFKGAVTGFRPGDSIAIAGIAATDSSYDSTHHLLTLFDADGDLVGSLHVNESPGLSDPFVVTTDGSSTTVTVSGPTVVADILPVTIFAKTGQQVSLATILTDAFGSTANFSQVYLSFNDASVLSGFHWEYWSGVPSQQIVTSWSLPPGSGTEPMNQQSDLGVPVTDFAHTFLDIGNAINPTADIKIPVVSQNGTVTQYLEYQITVADPSLEGPAAASLAAPAPQDIVNSINAYLALYGNGVLANTEDCESIARDVAGAAGAVHGGNDINPNTNSSQTANLNQPDGFWRIAYDAGDQTAPTTDWLNLLQPGDIVRIGWKDNKTGSPIKNGHTTTVLSVDPGVSVTFYDNADHATGNGTSIGTHTIPMNDAISWEKAANPDYITIYRLTTDGRYLVNTQSANQLVYDTVYNDDVELVGPGDTIFGGTGNEMIDGVSADLQGVTLENAHAGDFFQFKDALTVTPTYDQATGVLSVAYTTATGQGTAQIQLAPDMAATFTTAAATDGTGETVTIGPAATIQAPVITGFTPDTGVQGDFLTTASSLLIAGTAAPDALVRLFDGSSGSTQIGQVVADANGKWSIAAQGLAAGAHSLTAQASDASGDVSPASAPMIVTIDANAPDDPPVVSASGFSLNADQVVSFGSAASISVTDPDGDAITDFQIYENTPPAGTVDGHFLVNGVVQPTGQTIDAGSDLSSVEFVGGHFPSPGGTDVLWVRASDGAQFSQWVSFIATSNTPVSPPVNDAPPVVTAAPVDAAHSAMPLSASSLIVTASDPNGDPITKYEFWDDGRSTGTADDNTDPTAGHFTLDGVQEPEGQAIEVTAAQLQANDLTFSPSGTNIVWVRAEDGFAYGTWVSFTVTAPADTGPMVSVTNQTVGKNLLVSASQFGVTAQDADNDPIATYQFWDSNAEATGGHFVLDGVVQQAQQNITVTAAQLQADDLMFQAGNGPGGVGSSDLVWVRAADSLGFYGAWQSFTINAPNQAPVVTLTLNGGVNLSVGDPTVAAASLFTASDPDNDAITQYELWDDNTAPGTADDDPNPDTTGHFLVDGVVQPHGQGIFVTPDQLAQTLFEEGTQSARQILWVRANDGTTWSTWQSFTVTEAGNAAPKGNTAPVVQAPDVAVTTIGASFTAAQLFTATPGNNSTQITAVRFWDGGGDTAPLGGIGHFVLNGQTLPEQQNIEVDSADLSALTFQSGSGPDLVWVQAFDGFSWSDWVSFHVNAPVDSGPPLVMTTPPANEVAEQTVLQASSLFTASDQTGGSIQSYEVWQQESGDGSHFALTGVAVDGFNHNIDVPASQLSLLTFETGASPGTDVLWVRANDGVLWSAWQSFTVVTDPPPGNAASDAPIQIEDGALSEVTGASSAAVNFAGSTGTLQLDDGQDFSGAISGFSGSDRIDLRDIAGTGAAFAWQPNDNDTGGTLTVTDGTHAAKLALLGQYTAANFSLGVDGHGGTIVNDPPTVAASIDPPALAAHGA